MVLAVTHGVFRTYKGGLKPFKLCGLSPTPPASGARDHRVERVQVVTYHGDLAGAVPFHQAGLIDQPVQFVCKFPRTAWEVLPGLKVKVHSGYHAFIQQWCLRAPQFWQQIGMP